MLFGVLAKTLQTGEAATSKPNRPQAEQPEQPPPRRDYLSWNPTPVPADVSPAWQPEQHLARAFEAANSGSVSSLQPALLATVAALMLTLIGVAYYVRMVTTAPCSSPACQRLQALLDANLNASVPPCVDFYGHVCSRWEAAHSHSVRDTIYQELMAKVATMANEATPPQRGQTAMQKAAMLYQSCAHVYTLDRNHMGEARSLLADFGVRWPELSNTSRLLRIFVSMSTTWSWASVLQFIVQSNGHVTLRPSPFYGLVLSGRQRMLEKSTDKDHYQAYYDSMVAAFGGVNARAHSYREHKMLEDKMVPALSAALATPNWTALENSTFKAMVNKTDNPIQSSEWESSIRSSLNFSEGSVLLVSIENVYFFKQFFALVVSQSEAVMAYYVGWVVAQALSLLSSSETVTKYFISDKALASREHALFCADITHVYMGIAFYADYLSRQITTRVLVDVLTVETTVQAALRRHLGASPWLGAIPEPMLTEAGLVGSLRLLEAPNATTLDDMYGLFPDMSENVFDNVRLAADARAMTAADISMAEFVTNGSARLSFHPAHGQFELLPEVLEKPLYALEDLDAVKYATLGGEVAEAFSATAFAETTDRKLQLAFTLKSACFFGSQVLLRHLGLEHVELVRRVTSFHVILGALAEATNGRVQTARLAGYEDWTDVELLLVIWCFVQCGGRNGRRKCNGPLTVVDDFARAFGCKQADPMYSGRNCAIAR
ncbi:neprilysin-1 [Rhipicephalus sanguineus]|uniref:neprilysin-1 n=1 Tax=Rhipicephalus sanguineus TaxID=34632 RepID=UPI001893CAC8|nr:neprilysin-1 [Rhipicephalus sanguineus]